ncbi:AAA and adenylate/guanylate cyclase domain-containing protein [Mesorhizobium sp. BH1-1-5]|uniref:AAA and adenylate/guanylate cyclase domain-containing protein n=1 Tax=Mesorhizobium sp. BH1-1-5 TaxID=2876661 RepID=UPI001CCB3B0C|nr:AAA and adenylate/guanylate cyclase domain-containing protein [Mesorhizobium sp. BH1-1-5]
MTETHALLESFLPLKLLGRLHAARSDGPVAVEFPAAVMFVDVSRYTALVEQLARRGQEGLERIPNLLNRSYSRCVEQVHERGGEVLYLAGDELLAYWAADADGLAGAVKAATACAEAICGSQNDRSDNGESDVAPALHVGVGAGPLWAAVLGSQRVWTLFAGGSAVVQAARSQAAARRWEYVVSEKASLALTGLHGSRPYLDARATIPPPADWLARFLPVQLRDLITDVGSSPATGGSAIPLRSVENRRTAIHLDTLAEIRPITALFARIVGLDYGQPQDLARYQSLYAALQEDLRSRGGPAGELLLDDKGLVFFAAFGARGSFHRDDPSRAVDAARAISLTVQHLGLSASVGVATGDAHFSVVGSARRRQLMVFGAAVNRAARLMTASTTILCDAPTERASRRSFRFEERGTLQLEGLGEMATVFCPADQRAPEDNTTALLGRQSEMAALERAFREAREGSRRLVVILGESGIGKTALIKAFTDELRLMPTAVFVADAERDDRRTSFLPWRRLFAAVLGILSESDGVTILQRVTERIHGHPSIVARLPLLADVLGVEIPQNEATRHLEGANRADATMRLLGDLMDTLSPRPLVLVLEDSQWLDSASWRLVEWVLSSLTSLLLILCVRSDEVPEQLKNLRKRAEAPGMNAGATDTDDPARFCRILDLEELSDASICELVARTLGDAPPHDELLHRVCALAGGNPFFAEEIVLTLKSQGLIALRDGSWRPIRPLDRLKYFDGVERVIRERVDRLDAGAQDAIKAAAVIGRTFSREALVTLLKGVLHRDAVTAAVDSLAAAHLVHQVVGSASYEFRHDQIRDVVYGAIHGEVRQRLHGALAAWMESSQSAATGADIATLVQHFEAAGDGLKAVRYANLAATKALQIGAFREVESFLGICLNYEPEQPWSAVQRLQAVRWRRQLGEAQYSRGDLHGQGISVRRALKLAGEPVPRSSMALLTRLLGSGGRLAFQQIFPPSARSGRDEATVSWEQELTRCLNQAAVVDFFELRFSRAFSHTVAAVTYAERTGVTTEVAVASAQLACGLGILGWRRACRYFMARAERVAITLADPSIHSHLCNLDALWRIGHCDWMMVDRRLDQSQELCLQAGDQLSWCNAQAIRFWSLYYRGHSGELEHTAQALLSRAQNSGNLQQEIWALRCKSLCVLQADSPREAVDILRLTTSAMVGSADLADMVSAKGSLALALARIGQHAESVRTVVETLRLLRDMGRPTVHSTLPGLTGVIEVLLRGREAGLSREYDQWRHWERQALHELKRYRRVFPVGGPQHELWVGVAHWLDGRNELAVSAWKRGLAAAQRLALLRDASIIAAEMRRRLDRV